MTTEAGLANLRDLGGLATTNGRTTRGGVLLRSDAPYAGDVDEPAGLSGWPPARVIDLRGQREAANATRSWGSATSTRRIELHGAARLGTSAPTGTLEDLYRRILRDASERIVSAIGLLAPEGSTLIHCAAGKDRTGIVVATILTLAGVEREEIVDDYRRTASSMPGVVARLKAHRAFPAYMNETHPWLEAPTAAIEVVLDHLASTPGGPAGWYADHGGDRAALEVWLARFVGQGR